MSIFSTIFWIVILVWFLYKFVRAIRIVPHRQEYLVERLGKYHKTLGAGFHALIPFIDRVAYIIDLRERAIEVSPQRCFTKDNVKVEVDGIIYLQVMNSYNAVYGVTDYERASKELAQTTMRSVIGTLDLDTTFEERAVVNNKIIQTLDEVAETWGINVLRYEVKNIIPPKTVENAMERQLKAERERRVMIASAEGDKQSRINRSLGFKAEVINESEGEMQRRINEAEGKAKEVESITHATAAAIENMAAAFSAPGGEDAMKLWLSDQYLDMLPNVARKETSVLLPADMNNIFDVLKSIRITPDIKKN